MKSGFVYILEDLDGKYYIGSTSNLGVRLRQHSSGTTQTTRRMNNPRMVLNQKYATIYEARSIEKKMKKMKRRDYVEKMIREGFIRLSP